MIDDGRIATLLSRFRDRHRVPAIGAAVIDSDGALSTAVVGTTRRDHTEPASLTHQWHIGSCFKSITAALYALLVQSGHARWATPVAELFPDVTDTHPGWNTPTIDDVLRCRAGIVPNLARTQLHRACADRRALTDQRTSVAQRVLRQPPSRPGRFVYSNVGYILVGAAIDRLTGDFEDTLRTRILAPLHITSAGFGPPPEIWGHQPRHRLANFCVGRGRAVGPDQMTSDNPAVYNPAGRLHLTLADWATIQRNLYLDIPDGLLEPDTVTRLLQLPADGNMAMGWASANSIDGASYGMQGSNTNWAATALLDTHRRHAAMIITNDGRTHVLTHSPKLVTQLLGLCRNPADQRACVDQ